MRLEVCANSVQSALNAQQAGAYRVELCDSLSLGGTTPSYGAILLARRMLNIKLNVLIRPRAGEFLYSDLEFETIKEDILMAKQLQADGVVCGVLLSSGKVDIARTKELVELARPMSFTFHRAFDCTPDPIQALEDVIATGADRILTSGLKPKAIEAIPLLSQLVKQSNGRIIIMPGSGVNAGNLPELAKCGTQEFHLSGQHTYDSKMEYRKSNIPLCSPPPHDYLIYETSLRNIEQAVEVVKAL